MFDFYPFTQAVLINGNKAVVKQTVGHFCGYVALPKDKVPPEWHGNYDADALQYLNIHGGITYCEVNDDYIIFGFDCAHAGDETDPNMQSVDCVMKLVEDMEKQLVMYAEVIDEFRSADKDRAIEIIESIRQVSKTNNKPGFGMMIDMLNGATKFN